MKKILVSLVSDQTIPNITFIKISLNQFDEYWFITTAYTEGESKSGNQNSNKSKSEWIINTCDILHKSKKIKVIEDDLKDIHDKIDEEVKKQPQDVKYVLNMTCGTKMMSLGTYLYFKIKTDEIYYIPLTSKKFKNLITSETKDAINLTIDEYLSGYGIKYKFKTCLKDVEYCDRFMAYFNSPQFDFALIENLRLHYRRKPKIEIDKIQSVEELTESDKGKKIEHLSAFLESIGFELKDPNVLSKEEIDYLTGGWFEEWTFFKIKALHQLDESSISLGVLLEKSDIINQNDLDVVVILSNKLIVIECKTGMQLAGKVTPLFNETMYKAAAIKKNFGLNVESYLFTLEDLSKSELINKASILSIKVVDKNVIMDSQLLENALKQMSK